MTLAMILASCIAVAVPAGAVTQNSATIDYDTYMRFGEQRRIELFNAASPETRADLVRTHIERWLALHRNRLTTEQIELMEDNLAFVTADVYGAERTPESVARQKELERRSTALFAVEDIRQALTIHGDYIPRPGGH